MLNCLNTGREVAMEKQNERERTTMTLSLTVEDKQFLKIYAVEKGTTVAAVIHELVEGLRKEQNK